VAARILPVLAAVLLVGCAPLRIPDGPPSGGGQPLLARVRDTTGPLTSLRGGTPGTDLAPTPEPDPEPQPDPEPGPSAGTPAYGTYAWPVEGPVIRYFDPPDTPYGSGHRGIDIAAAVGTPVRAAAAGVVAFAGPVAGALYVSVDHPDGVRTTYSWLGDVRVRRGAEVARREVIAATGGGHPGSERPHLHLGARIGQTYIDPMLLLERGSLVGLVRLAPLDRSERGAPGSPGP
jgi:murein DD-endopeptidase MepM/ murein hydrolase activator NlpD